MLLPPPPPQLSSKHTSRQIRPFPLVLLVTLARSIQTARCHSLIESSDFDNAVILLLLLPPPAQLSSRHTARQTRSFPLYLLVTLARSIQTARCHSPRRSSNFNNAALPPPPPQRSSKHTSRQTRSFPLLPLAPLARSIQTARCRPLIESSDFDNAVALLLLLPPPAQLSSKHTARQTRSFPLVLLVTLARSIQTARCRPLIESSDFDNAVALLLLLPPPAQLSSKHTARQTRSFPLVLLVTLARSIQTARCRPLIESSDFDNAVALLLLLPPPAQLSSKHTARRSFPLLLLVTLARSAPTALCRPLIESSCFNNKQPLPLQLLLPSHSPQRRQPLTSNRTFQPLPVVRWRWTTLKDFHRSVHRVRWAAKPLFRVSMEPPKMEARTGTP